jgi:hypothetical protein
MQRPTGASGPTCWAMNSPGWWSTSPAVVSHCCDRPERERRVSPARHRAATGCPRRIVHHEDGTIRAVCGDSPKACADLDLNKNDIMVYGLDRVGLARSIAAAFDLSNRPASFDRRPVFRIGSHDVFAGRGFPVFLTVPGPLVQRGCGAIRRRGCPPGTQAAAGPDLVINPAATRRRSRSRMACRAWRSRICSSSMTAGNCSLASLSTVVFADLRAQIESGMDNAVSNWHGRCRQMRDGKRSASASSPMKSSM